MRKSMISSCSVCCEERKSRTREFSPNAWYALSTWGEVEINTLGQPICEGCYRELRDLLIERADDFENLSRNRVPEFAPGADMANFANAKISDAQIAS